MNSLMDKKNIEIALLNDLDIPELIHFYNVLYKETRNEAKFKWEFFNAPAGKAIYVVAKDAETQKIVGSQCAIPMELINDTNEVILTGKSEDTLVHPEYRGMNIFENMYTLLFEKCRERNIRYLWGFTSAKKPFLKLGFSIPYDHSQSLMVINTISAYAYLSKLNPKNTVGSLLKIMILCVGSKLISYKRFLANRKGVENKFSFSAYDKTVVKDNQLVPMKKYTGFWMQQDLPFLTWRITNNPYLDDVFNIYFSATTGIAANLIFNHHKNGVWYLICDNYADELTEDERTMILHKAIRLLLGMKKNGINIIRTWDFTHNEQGRDEIKRRSKTGFIHIDRGISFVWKSLDPNEALQASDFNLSRIASQGTI